MKYNISTSYVNVNPTEQKLAQLKPYKIKRIERIDAGLFRDKISVEKEINSTIANEQQFLFGKRG